MEYTLDAFELIPTVQLASRPIESKWRILKHRNSKKRMAANLIAMDVSGTCVVTPF